ncbi:hypothetical protein EDC01DRAFT_776427 [Geopyxis carbonaria]|nr:hypothetical protein EDC01DRAFT_776427 [Geopyxis carbonaria]
MRHRPSPLLRLSAGPHDPAAAARDDLEITPSATQFPSFSREPAAGPHNHNIRSHHPSSSRTLLTTHPSPKFVAHSPAAFANPPTAPTAARTPGSQHSGRPDSSSSLSSSAATPRFPSMFRLGSRPKSPRRAANSAMYATQPYGGAPPATAASSVHGGPPGSPTNSTTTVSQGHDPHQRPFSPWSSTDSQSSTSPRNSTARGPQSIRNKRSLSPTTSVSTATTATSIMTKSSRSFLTGRRKHSSGLNEEFDPTTFRKNRSRPSRGARGQDAVYQEYDDLFEDELEDMEEGDEDGDELDEPDGGLTGSHHPSEDEDGFFLLQMDENDPHHPHHHRNNYPHDNPHHLHHSQQQQQQQQQQSQRTSLGRERKPSLRLSPPKTRGASLPPPQPNVPPPPPPPLRGSSLQHPVQSNSYLQLTSSNTSVPPPPPTPPPKSWRRSVVTTTTPPHSTAPSVDGSQELQHQPTTVISAPPTPPPKPSLALSIDTGVSSLYGHRDAFLPHSSIDTYPSTSNSTSATDATRVPPLRSRKRFSKRLSGVHASDPKRPRSIPEGLGIVNIPSPTLFYAGASFAAGAGDSWGAPPAHASPALTSRSFTPRQASHGSGSGSGTAIKGTPSLPDDCDDAEIHSDPGEGYCAGLENADINITQPLTLRSKQQQQQYARQSTSTQATSYLGSDAGTIKVKLEVESDYSSGRNSGYSRFSNQGDSSAVTDTSVETLLDSMLSETSESEAETARRASTATAAHLRVDTAKEVAIEDGKEVVGSDHQPGLEPVDHDTTPKPLTNTTTLSLEKNPLDAAAAGDDSSKDDSKPDAAYLRAFRAFVKASGDNDAFVSRAPRFDAIQAQRICSHLRADFPLQPDVRPKKRRNSKVRHREAGEEIMTSLWALMALRWLNYGKVVISPGHHALLAASAKQLTRRATVKFDDRAAQMLADRAGLEDGDERERRRVLDLGGMPVADWGWHCAMDYPKVKVYTVTQRPASRTPPSSPAPPAPKGPRNHRHLAVERLYRLPFPANHFDVVSARTLFLILRPDEYERALDECMRVLKPGGHLEFALFDADIVNAGPLASSLATTFAAQLRTAGRDPEPTRRWIARLNKAGFDEIRRSWLFLPMAPPPKRGGPRVPAKGEDAGAMTDSLDLEVVKEEVRRRMRAWEEVGVEKGGVEYVAGISGLVGGWSWEKWMQVAGVEAVAERVAGMMEEAREQGSGWRCLVGWARKPE